MEEKVAIIGIFIQDVNAAAQVNELLHEYADCIVGRIGIPYREKSLNIISVIVDATSDQISTLSGKLGRIKGITAKAMQAKF
ncbi:MAG: iron-only hydrogenase system regulator [Firmicutes bacterium]|nr:iron-only hydrogenase system regulator [Bacillota bacterium]